MTESFSHDVFLSHGAKDKAVARAVAERLRTCRAVAARRRRKDGLKVWPVPPKHLRVWFDEWELKPADSIPAKIDPPPLRSYGGTGEGLERSQFSFQPSAFILQPFLAAPTKSSLAQFLCMNWPAAGRPEQ
jgi:hypothetical protein